MANTTVMSVNMNCSKCKRVALQSVTRIDGIDSITVSKDNTIKVIGDADPVNIVSELRRKFKCAYLVSSGPTPPPPPPPKKEEKKEEPKKEEPKKEEPAKVEEKKEDPKKEEPKKEEKKEDPKKEEKKEDPKKEDPKPNPPPPQPIIYYPSYPPAHPCKPVECCRCSDCQNRSDIMWPRYQPPKAPNEVWYVWNEENQSNCTIC